MLWAKVQERKSYKTSNFENNSNFLEISELKCLISQKRFGVLMKNFAHLLARPKSVTKPKFVSQSLKFFKIGELWSTCFAVGEKVWKSNSRRPNIVGQVQKQQSYEGSNF